ncbi:MAG: S-layer-like protein array protein [Candidatus Kaiserbacteria bacterium GW2011_GWC2_52_8b]|uniref:S-layer-like protein array protein n=2 Tax=Candidatus Kaiseribacteriota TaxID=1752734 RepID=A0A0G1ZQC7_9BACT|nr:MAG: S-layer-like protein array protein [Candidatus Kaiserbacteria bacterium GW2011_GWA2_52_12]KKW30442.1 MAG: S-layer-like protein array protein [Candidatus Kaiserbacteria bacterium GW2011_GWC2_52_8b]
MEAICPVMRHKSLLLFAGAMLTVPFFAHAQVAITEIMYDLPGGSDSGREWVEVYNAGVAPIDLTKLRLNENGTNHKITAVAGGNTLSPASYAVIADDPANFRVDWSQFSGQLFDSAFSLSNDGEMIGIRDASSTEIASVSYSSGWGAGGDGNSLNRSPNDAGAFIARKPSPGAAMADSAIAPKPKAQPAPVASKTKAATKSGAKLPVVETDTATEPADFLQIAATTESSSPYQWWLAAGALALATAAAIFVARKYAKDEWDIVEE